MSGIISSTPNYGGRQPENTAYIKQFVSSDTGLAVWVYKKIQNSLNVFITPADQNKNVLIPKDLTVLGSINNPSDISLKHDICPLQNDITDKVLDLNPVSYKYNFHDDNDSNNKIHYGFIAQEVEQMFPELVLNNLVVEDKMYKTVNYMELIPMMLSKMQKMQKEIDDLKIAK